MIVKDSVESIKNPFTVISPEKLNASQAKQLFVEVFSDFPQVKNPGHAMILGARGSGKSMMFRCLLPDVLKLSENVEFVNISLVAFHIPIKNTQLKITDLQRLDEHHAAFLINEHFLTLSILIEIFRALYENISSELEFIEQDYRDFYENVYKRYMWLCRSKKTGEYSDVSVKDFFKNMFDHALEMLSEFRDYILEISPERDQPLPQYNLPLLSYTGFIIPFFQGITELPGFPKANTYLFIDDADNLSLTQTKVLNSWLATRTQPEISLKVSAQIGRYKSYVSTNNSLVEYPHDYQEVNISDRYTTSKTSYFKRVEEIIEKRLILAGIINVTSQSYFPIYKKQEAAIRLEAEKLKSQWETAGRGNRPEDDALRYARPDYIKQLGGDRKSRSKYMYSGLEQLVHLSSGVIRFFLDSAALMFDRTIKIKGRNYAQKYIPYNIQNEVAREQADKMMFSQFRKLEKDNEIIKGELGIVDKLQNLVFSLGHTFFDVLISDRSERRVFSFALSNIPTKEIKAVLDLGVQTGYFHLATIGNKDGSGRTWLYILNRCIAPHFNLDPTGFAGYLFATNQDILNAMMYGKRIRELDSLDEPEQLILFD